MHRYLTLTFILLLVCVGGQSKAVEFRRFMNLVEEPGLTIMAPGTTIDEWCENYGAGRGVIRVFAVYDVDHRQRLSRLGGDYQEFVQQRAMPLIQQHCDIQFDMVWLIMLRETDHDRGTPQIFDIMYFDVRDGRVFYSGYAPVAARQVWSQAEMDALAPTAADKMPSRLPDPLYSDDAVMIYARENTWCQRFREAPPPRGGGLDLVYQVPYERRHEVTNYSEVGVIERLVAEAQCIPQVLVYTYWPDQEEHWEKMKYERTSTYPDGRPRLGITQRDAGPSLQAARDAYQQELDRYAWGGGDCDGQFCDLPGGQYLNAVFAADVDALKRFDVLVDTRIQRRYIEPLRSVFETVSGREVRSDFSLLVALADTYLYDYQSTAMACQDDLVPRQARHTLDTYDLYNLYGMYMGQGGGETFTANYLIKPEFASLCDRICDHLGGRTSNWIVNELGHRGAKLTFAGMKEIQSSYDCNDPVVLQFEANLIRLTEQYLREKTEWLGATRP